MEQFDIENLAQEIAVDHVSYMCYACFRVWGKFLGPSLIHQDSLDQTEKIRFANARFILHARSPLAYL